MSKFILIDHSIRGLGGHYYEYAEHVLRAAAEAGYTPILATNRDFPKSVAGQQSRWVTHPVYTYDIWGVSESRSLRYQPFRHLRRWLGDIAFRCKLGVSYSPLGLLLAGKDAPGKVLWSPVLRRWWRPDLLFLHVLAGGMKGWRGFKSREEGTAAGVRRGRGESIRRSPKGEAGRTGPLTRDEEVMRAFERDTRNLFRRISLEEGDMVFVPTLSETDMLGLMRYLRSDPISLRATWHLLFRRNVYTGKEPDYPSQEEKVAPVREAFVEFAGNLPQHRLFFYTDTERLTAQYEHLGVVPFRTLPIPVNRRFHPESRGPAGNGPLRVIYAGDARSEKGYQHLYSIVRDLWADYVEPGKVRFCFQSNYAFKLSQPQGGVIVSRVQMEGLGPDGVTLVKEPLRSDDYMNSILSGDINLLLYHPENYYARSSGVLVESLSAGIPVIVPTGTWLSQQIDGAIHRHRWRLLQALDHEVLLEGQTSGFIDIPPGISFVLVNALFSVRNAPGSSPRLMIQQMDPYGCEVRRQTFVLTTGSDGGWEQSAMARIDRRARNLRFVLSSDQPVHLNDIRVLGLSAGGQEHPLGAVGLTYGSPEEISMLLRDLIDHYEHYRRTAAEFAGQWLLRHNADRLVKELADSSAADSEAMLVEAG